MYNEAYYIILLKCLNLLFSLFTEVDEHSEHQTSMANKSLSNGTQASRSLFQDDSPEQPNSETEENRINIITELLKDHAAEARERWNFDFENETPLEGEWEWEKMGDAEDTENLNNQENNHTETSETERRH